MQEYFGLCRSVAIPCSEDAGASCALTSITVLQDSATAAAANVVHGEWQKGCAHVKRMRHVAFLAVFVAVLQVWLASVYALIKHWLATELTGG